MHCACSHEGGLKADMTRAHSNVSRAAHLVMLMIRALNFQFAAAAAEHSQLAAAAAAAAAALETPAEKLRGGQMPGPLTMRPKWIIFRDQTCMAPQKTPKVHICKWIGVLINAAHWSAFPFITLQPCSTTVVNFSIALMQLVSDLVQCIGGGIIRSRQP